MHHKYTIITYYSNITGYIFITCRPNTEGKWGGGLIDVGDGKQIALRLGPGGRGLGGRGQATPTSPPPYVQILATPLRMSTELQSLGIHNV